MNTYFKLIFIILLAAFVVQTTPATAQSMPAVNLSFDKNFYDPGESFTATATISNPSEEKLQFDRLTISIFPALKPGASLSQAFKNTGRPVISQNSYTPIPPGETKVGLSRNLQTLELSEGVYPAELRLVLAYNETIVDHSYLVVIGPKDRQMPVAMVWNLHQPERRLPEGIFSDNNLAGLIVDKPEGQGLLNRQLSILSELPTVKTNLAVSPILLEQLSSMSAGYSWKEGRTRPAAAETSESAQSAKSWLDSLKKTRESGQTEILTSPYGQSPLPTLADLGWDKDIPGQLKEAQAACNNVLGLNNALPGLYPPGLFLDKRSASRLVKSKIKYTVAHVNASGDNDATAKPLPPLDFKTSFGHLTIFQSDPEITGWLHAVSPEKAGQELTALLAQRLLSEDSDKIVTIAQDEAHTLPGADLLQQIYQSLAQTPWVKTVTLASLVDQIKSPANLKDAKQQEAIEPGYIKRVERARQDLSDFTAGVSPTNELRKQLEHQLYVCESIDYLVKNDNNFPPIGNIYADNIRRTINSEFAKLELAPPSKITFSTKSGKIPVVVMNRTGYPIKARLSFSGKDFLFSDDKKEIVTLMPKENLISHNITAGFVGISKLNVKIMVGERIIAGRNIEVTVSSVLRYIVMIAMVLSTVGIAAMVYFRGRRG